MSLGQVLRSTFRNLVGIVPARGAAAPAGFLTPSTSGSAWSDAFVRTKTRNHFPRPNENKRIKKHGWWTRMATKEGRRVLQRRILKGRYVLMLLKSFGGRPISFNRYFCVTTEAANTVKRKRYRNVDFCTPSLSPERKQSIEKIVSIQMTGTYVNYTTLLRDGNILNNFKTILLPEDMNKFNLDNVYNNVTALMKDLPESDIYIIENYVKMPSNVNVAGANLFYVKLQTLAMLIALINSRQTVNSSPNNQQSPNKVILMRARLHARLFRIIIGSEIISSQDITELMFKGTFPDYVTPVVPRIDAVLSFRTAEEPILKELMSNGLLLAMTFVDLVLNSNQKTIEALNQSYRRKFKKSTDIKN